MKVILLTFSVFYYKAILWIFIGLAVLRTRILTALGLLCITFFGVFEQVHYSLKMGTIRLLFSHGIYERNNLGTFFHKFMILCFLTIFIHLNNLKQKLKIR